MPAIPWPLSNLHIEQLKPRNRWIILIAGACIAISIYVVMGLSGHQEYEILYKDLVPTDAAGIVGKLKEQGIPYRLSTDGTSVEVPSSSAAELRLSLATEGFPKGGGVGYEIFDKSSFGQTDFTQRMNYLRALQGELERMIGALSPVGNAKVILQIPQESIYLDEEPKPPTASVVIDIKPGAGFTRAEVKGIKNLVSNSVPGMTTENVTIVDKTGKILSDAETDGKEASIPNELVVLQREHERLLQTRIESMLDPVLGPGRAVVRVNAEMDMDSVERQSETFDPVPGSSTGVVRSRTETRTGTNSSTSGAEVGVTANDGSGVSTGTGQGLTSGDSSSSTNYEISKRQEKLVRRPGGIKRITVSVLVDSVEAAQIPQLRDAVRSAAGIDETRGDVVVVESVEFSGEKATTAVDKAPVSMDKAKTSSAPLGMGTMIGAGAGLGIIIILLLFMVLKRKKKVKAAVVEAIPLQQEMPAVAFETAVGDDAYDLSDVEPVKKKRPKLDFNEDNDDRNELFDEIEKRIRRDPMAASLIVKGWMSEEE